jgi:beta-N-acetylhexosaminidase
MKRSIARTLAAALSLVPTVASAAPFPVSSGDATLWANRQVATLSLERKVAQMIWEPIRAGYFPADDPEMARLVALARDQGVGGFVIYGGTPHEVAQLLNSLQAAAALPLLISADFEGGPGQQLDGATEFPADMALGAIGSPDIAYEVGRVGAEEGRAVGIHVTYSPVVDVQTDPRNPAMSVRSFGADLGALAKLAAAYVRGYQENGMLATAKHYPGRGDVELIPGTDFTVNKKPAARIVAEDLEAFRAAIDAGVAFVMSDHIAAPSLTDGSDLPASVDAILARVWLRERLGFEGVLTSDDLLYPKVIKRFGAVRACVMAVRAGHDAILKPADSVAAIQGIVAAVRAGEIPEAQIDASVHRILYWKARLGLHLSRNVDVSQVAQKVGTRAHRALAARVADESLTLVHDAGFFPSSRDKVGRVLHVAIQRKEHEPAVAEVAKRLETEFAVAETLVIGPGADAPLRSRVLETAQTVDTVLVSVFHQRKSYVDNGALAAADRNLIDQLSRVRPRATIVMSYGNPYVAGDAASATAFLTGYGEGGFFGNQLAYVDSLVRLLKGEIKARGRLPVSVPPDVRLGAGIVR